LVFDLFPLDHAMINISQLCTTYSTIIRRRNRLAAEETEYLNSLFLLNPKPNRHERQKIASKLDMSERTVQIWFQNRRAKVKRSLAEKTSPSIVKCQEPEGKSSVQNAEVHKGSAEDSSSRTLFANSPYQLDYNDWSSVPSNMLATQALRETDHGSDENDTIFPSV
jgi:hypothetical protein